MDFQEAKETFSNMFTDKSVTYTFDDNCIRQIELIMEDGFPNIVHHVEYNKVKISVEGLPDKYVPIQSYRMTITNSEYKIIFDRIKDKI